MLQCELCRTPLPLNAANCPNCGAFVIAPAASSAPASSQGWVDPGSETVAYGSPGQVSSDGLNNAWGQSPYTASPPAYDPALQALPPVPDPNSVPPSSPSYGGMNYGQPYMQAPQQQPQQGYYPGASSPYYGAPPVQPMPAPPNYQNNAPQRRFSRKTMIALIAVACLVILSGVGLIYYTAVAHPAQLRAEATATVQAASTASANRTATVNAQVTGTAQAAHAQATTQARATATSIQQVYTNATNGTPAFDSTLAAQDGGNWDVYDAKGGGGCAFTNGALHSSITQKSFYVPCFAHTTNFDNFAYEVEMTIAKGDEGGLIFRANDAASKYYFFRIGRDSIYSLTVSKNETNSTPIIYDTSPAIKTATGQTNTLTVIARSKNIYLFINKQFVASTTDGSYGAGNIGIFAADNANATDVAFKNARVWTLQ